MTIKIKKVNTLYATVHALEETQFSCLLFSDKQDQEVNNKHLLESINIYIQSFLYIKVFMK